MIPYGRQSITQADIDAVKAVLTSDFLTQGPQVPAFEAAIKGACNVEHAVAVNSATSALHIACLALGSGPGDAVWTSPNSFVASANCALYTGASVDFVDIDPATFNMCPDALSAKLAKTKAEGGLLPKIVIPVHLTGQSADMAPIADLAQEYGFKIIEDASHAIGGAYKGQPVGDCAYSDICVFSFHPVKIVTTAEGGVCTTQNADLATRLQLYRSHGVTRDKALMTHESHGPWYYQQVELGLNYRMTEMQAALGVSQMSRLTTFVDRRNELAERYDDLLKGLPLKTPFRRDDTRSAFHLYVIQLKLDEITKTHLDVFNALREAGLGVNLHYIPIHTQPYYRNLGFRDGQFPAAEDYYSRSISIPLYHGMTEAQQDEVVQILRDVLT
jgi:UDP-4-amino-4,6-dideoxy-N-acetyl-beta-L-altrosamine transaminase